MNKQRAYHKRVRLVHPPPPPRIDGEALVNAMPSGVLVLDAALRVQHANAAAEQLFAASTPLLLRRSLADIVDDDSPLCDLARRVLLHSSGVSEYGLTLRLPRAAPRIVDAHLAALHDPADAVLVVIHPCSTARRLDQQVASRGAARSVASLAATLAHEVKNPLSGIRGAAQLLEANVPSQDRPLTRLICDEADRICALVDRMDQFADGRPLRRNAVNIHQVLDHVHGLAQNGFARHVRLIARYDPSLPPVLGERDRLIQVFLNLVKNAAEAAPRAGGEVTISTHYEHGLWMTVSNSRDRQELPITVQVHDNGPGVSDDIAPHLFDPFVTTKANGTGLGLSLVAKLVGDHGGAIDHRSDATGTTFRVRLPASRSAP